MSENRIADEIREFYEGILPSVKRANAAADSMKRIIVNELVYTKTVPRESPTEKIAKAKYSVIPAIFLKPILDRLISGGGERFMKDLEYWREYPKRRYRDNFRESRSIIDRISFVDLVPYLEDVETLGLSDANRKWRNKSIPNRAVKRPAQKDSRYIEYILRKEDPEDP